MQKTSDDPSFAEKRSWRYHFSKLEPILNEEQIKFDGVYVFAGYSDTITKYYRFDKNHKVFSGHIHYNEKNDFNSTYLCGYFNIINDNLLIERHNSYRGFYYDIGQIKEDTIILHSFKLRDRSPSKYHNSRTAIAVFQKFD